MKKLLVAGVMSLVSIQSFAQIDDVVNKPRSEKESRAVKNVNGEGELYKAVGSSLFSFLIPKFDSIGISSLVDEMRSDGVKERKFTAAFTLDGHFAGADIGWAAGDGDTYHFLPFSVTITPEQKIQVTASLGETTNWIPKFIRSGGLDSFEYLPWKKFQFATFFLDEGVEFRDIRRIGFNIVKGEALIPVVGYSGDSYLGFVFGGELGFAQETIKLDDGSTMKLAGRKESGNLGLSYGFKGGIEIKDKVGKGIVLARGVVEFSELQSGQDVHYDPKDPNKTTWDLMGRTKLYVKPEIVYSRPVGQKNKRAIEVGVGANLRLADRLRSMSKYPDFVKMELEDRTRSKYNATLKLKF